MKYYLLKVVDDNSIWLAAKLGEPTGKALPDGSGQVNFEIPLRFTTLFNFAEIGEYIDREIRVNLGED